MDKKAIAKLLQLCSEIVVAYPQIAEMDLNPVIVHQQGLSIVDARVILKSDEECRMSEERCRINGKVEEPSVT